VWDRPHSFLGIRGVFEGSVGEWTSNYLEFVRRDGRIKIPQQADTADEWLRSVAFA